MVKILCTTLRDGAQAAGMPALTQDEKRQIAKYCADIGVDIVEAGFPANSREVILSMQEIGRLLPDAEVAALARVYRSSKGSFPDIDAAYEALKTSEKKRLHVFIGTSQEHIDAKHQGLGLEDIISLAQDGIRYGRRRFGESAAIQFSTEDGSRTPVDKLKRVVGAAVDAGADVINIPDTVGIAVPHEFAAKIREIYRSHPKIRDGNVDLSVHCHNDLGLANANALEAVRTGGATQVETAILGIGERGGMTAMEQLVMAMRTRPDIYGSSADHINSEFFFEACHSLAKMIELDITRHPVVGTYAFSHEAGIHQHGQLSGGKKGIRNVYEIMDPMHVGWKGNQFIIGKHSGWHAVDFKISQLGYPPVSPEVAKRITYLVRNKADQNRYVFDTDIDDIMEGIGLGPKIEPYSVTDWRLSDGKDIGAQFILRMDGPGTRDDYVVGQGNGPVDAAVNAVSKATGIEKEFVGYRVQGTTPGSDAPGRVMISISDSNGDKVTHNGVATATDIIEASLIAYTKALNRMSRYHALHD